MLRNNSRRAVSSKQSHMAENKSFPSHIQNNTNNNPISQLLASPRFFNGLLTRNLSDVGSEISPKSILDAKQMFNLGNPFGYDRNNTNSTTCMDKKHKLESEGIKLVLVDPIENQESTNTTCSKANCKMVLFGTELKVQNTYVESPNCPTDFGIKTRDSQLLAFGTVKEEKDSSRGIADGLSLREMESSEDYTCVITHGPNPKTTHIFDNCVVDCCCSNLIDN
ncbi:FCS-Like Zinc finger 8-like [Lycium ferocissimum]|uniref:FCS-Like Zinc finger 8-like n=1 Tax=Lycium ferocissimum TaxID=112874 RepID=UPI002815DE5C|nr:FCS-Like Zinc finger 8-like [Lycium ferocissimum]